MRHTQTHFAGAPEGWGALGVVFGYFSAPGLPRPPFPALRPESRGDSTQRHRRFLSGRGADPPAGRHQDKGREPPGPSCPFQGQVVCLLSPAPIEAMLTAEV